MLVSVSLVVVLAGCNQGHDEMVMPDLAALADAGGTDLSMPDLKGPSCGQMALCIFKCGVTDLQCDQTCVAGAQPAAIQQAGALTLCAAQNCLGGLFSDGGANDTLSILQCLREKCAAQVNACDDLPFSGAM